MGYFEGRVAKYELRACALVDVSTGKELLRFDARAISERELRGGFAGGGIASASQSFKIATATVYDYAPYNHAVVVDEIRYIITARVPITHITPGERFTKTDRKEIVLTLE